MSERLDVETLKSRIASLVRQSIIDMYPGFEPGSRLNPRSLALRIGVSETPLKMALQELATQGLVDVQPRRGTYVSKLSKREVEELLEVRAGLEVLALRMLNSPILEETQCQMQECVRLCERALEEGEIEEYRRNDARFHYLIVQAPGNRRLVQIYETLTGSVQILNVYNPRQRSQQQESQREHRTLIDIFRAGDLQWSEAALTDHWRRSKQRLMGAYSPYLKVEER